jgi:hypothetical protein
MKTVQIGATPPTLEDLLKLADGENVILKTNDGREYVLAEVEDFDREISLMRQNEALMQLLDERSQEKTSNSPSEARRKLGL